MSMVKEPQQALADRQVARQREVLLNGNEAAAQAIVHLGYDGEGYYPITPSSEVGEVVSKAFARGDTDLAFVVGTSELAALSIVAGMSIAGGRAVDVTSANGLMLKAEEMPAISGLGLPVVMNLATREISAPLNIKNGHSDLVQALGWGWTILLAPTVQAIYDLNVIALRLAEEVRLPCLVAYDGFHTSHGVRKIRIFTDPTDARGFVGPAPKRLTILDVERPHTFGPYMNDDLINTKVRLDEKMAQALRLLPQLFEQYAALTGRRYQMMEAYGDGEPEAALFALNSAGEAAKDAVDDLTAKGRRVRAIVPTVLRPWPEQAVLDAIADAPTLVVAERASQYGAGNYLANEIGASVQRHGGRTRIVSRVYGLGGLNFRAEDARALFDLGLGFDHLPAEDRTLRAYYGAWPGDPDYRPSATFKPLTAPECTLNAGQTKVDLKQLAAMPHRIDKHTACPGCGIFTNLDLFLRGIDGHVVLLFNTGCGMVVTTGFPLTSFRVPYFHNLFHNGASTATGIVEMIKRFRAQGRLKEEITVILVTGDGGDDIGLDQLVGAALRNDPFIVLEYDNKGYMNTGGQLCYTGFKGQRSTNANLGPHDRGKRTHHKDIIDILRGTGASYLFAAAETQAKDMILKARKAQAAVRAGGFAFGKVYSTCPLNWGADPRLGVEIVDRAVKSCLHPLYEVESGITRITFDPEKRGQKLPVGEAFAVMGRAFDHLTKPEFADLLAEIQTEVDRRWQRLKAMAESPVL
jgi:pyruvate ferredoxin oxidoreductase alpha subunit